MHDKAVRVAATVMHLTGGQVKYQIIVAENNRLLCKFVITLSQCNSLSYTSPSVLPWSRTRYDDFTSHDKTTQLLRLL